MAKKPAQDPISFRPMPDVFKWLLRQPNRTQVINAAVAEYRDGKEEFYMEGLAIEFESSSGDLAISANQTK